MNNRRPWIALLALGFLVAAPAKASVETWHFKLAPYVWTAGIDGRLSHQSLPITLNPSASFSDVWSNLDMAGMVAFEARRERFGVFGDLIFVDLDTEVRIPIGSHHIPIGIDADTTTALLALQYRLRESDTGHLDLVAGIRYWSVRTKFSYTIPSEVPSELPIPRQYDRSQRERWPDVQVGLKGSHTFPNSVFVGGWALAGAGGAHLSTDLMLMLGYRFSDRTAVMLGYRRIDADFESDGFVFDAALHGPDLGLEFRF